MCGFIIHHITIKRDIKICIKRDTFHGICERKKKRNNNYKHLQLDQIIMIRHNNLGQTTTIEAIDKHVHTNLDTHTQHLLDSKQITCLKKSTTYPNSPISLSGFPPSLCQVWRWKHITLPREKEITLILSELFSVSWLYLI